MNSFNVAPLRILILCEAFERHRPTGCLAQDVRLTSIASRGTKLLVERKGSGSELSQAPPYLIDIVSVFRKP